MSVWSGEMDERARFLTNNSYHSPWARQSRGFRMHCLILIFKEIVVIYIVAFSNSTH